MQPHVADLGVALPKLDLPVGREALERVGGPRWELRRLGGGAGTFGRICNGDLLFTERITRLRA
jgi:hypothetical protein